MEQHVVNNDFEHLAGNIINVQDALQEQAAHAINLALTARNWLIGYYIVEYEQNGADRAQYGEQLLKKLAKRINRRGLGERSLYDFRQTYVTYTHIGKEVTTYLMNNRGQKILQLLTAKLQPADLQHNGISQSATAKSEIIVKEPWETPSPVLFNKLSATHLIYLDKESSLTKITSKPIWCSTIEY